MKPITNKFNQFKAYLNNKLFPPLYVDLEIALTNNEIDKFKNLYPKFKHKIQSINFLHLIKTKDEISEFLINNGYNPFPSKFASRVLINNHKLIDFFMKKGFTWEEILDGIEKENVGKKNNKYKISKFEVEMNTNDIAIHQVLDAYSREKYGFYITPIGQRDSSGQSINSVFQFVDKLFEYNFFSSVYYKKQFKPKYEIIIGTMCQEAINFFPMMEALQEELILKKNGTNQTRSKLML